MNVKHSTNFCRWCGTRLSFNFVLALLSPGEALWPFITHALCCPKVPRERRARWEKHARWFAAKNGGSV